ncbi:MAG: histidinol dehydrogenase [Leptospirillia bacterium]
MTMMVNRVKDLDHAREILAPVLARGKDEEARSVRERVSEIIASIRSGKNAALLDWARLLDGFSGNEKDLELSRDQAESAWKNLPAPLREALAYAEERIRSTHEMARKALVDLPAGPRGGMRWTPLDRVAVYVPGGTALYPSTVLMTATVARVAGVREISVLTPAGAKGITPIVLAACHVASVDRIFPVGGVHGIAALAFGTETLPAVDAIVGPGNRYVAEAKRQLYGNIAIDMIAGPTEVVVIADRGARADWIAADLLAQAEHDTQASAVLLTDSQELAASVSEEIEKQLLTLPREPIARNSLERFGAILVLDSLDLALRVADLLAPEHLELCVESPGDLAARVKNAGAIFLGSGVPEAAGDYCYGPSHVLPTNGTARFASPVGIETFLKRTSLVGDPRGEEAIPELDRILEVSEILARAEGLEGHARSAALRRRSTP